MRYRHCCTTQLKHATQRVSLLANCSHALQITFSLLASGSEEAGADGCSAVGQFHKQAGF